MISNNGGAGFLVAQIRRSMGKWVEQYGFKLTVYEVVGDRALRIEALCPCGQILFQNTSLKMLRDARNPNSYCEEVCRAFEEVLFGHVTRGECELKEDPTLGGRIHNRRVPNILHEAVASLREHEDKIARREKRYKVRVVRVGEKDQGK